MPVRQRSVPARQISRLISAVESLVELQAKAAKSSTSQEQNLVALKEYKETQFGLDPNYLQHQNKSRTKRQIRRQWKNEILECVSIFGEIEMDSLENIIAKYPPWSRKEFEWAYPQTFGFLKTVSVTTIQAKLSGCSVRYYNPYLPIARGRFGGMVLLEFQTSKNNRIPVPEQLWEIMQPAPTDMFRSRTLCITDLSPAIAAILIASTPRSVVSNLSPFIERYLSFSNFGKASLLSIKSEPIDTMNCYIFEYHFAFYHVTKEAIENRMARYDLRRLRKSSYFGGHAPDERNPLCRYIHEEQMSFFLAGTGQDRYYCYQLGEKYFKSIKSVEERMCVYSQEWTPSTLFLSWIAMALHHVGIRWHDAITAVDDLIASEKAVVFHEMDNFDLDKRAKDLNLRLLRTYFWAMEAYKLFEGTLGKTVDAWHHFKEMSLDKVNDDRNAADFDVSVELIERSIERLAEKIQWVRKRSEQVGRLREGLGLVASMSDTSITISQNDNIQLLTYVNILFLPLSLSASIFSMQLLGGSAWGSFISVMILMTVVTFFAVSIITRGMFQSLKRVVSQQVSRYKRGIHSIMLSQHHRGTDHEAVQRTTTAEAPNIWTCLVYLGHHYLLALPAREIQAAMSLYGLLSKGGSLHDAPVANRSGSDQPEQIPTQGKGQEAVQHVDRLHNQVQTALQKIERPLEPSPRRNWSLPIRRGLLTALRILLLAIWIPLVIVEYVLLLVFSLFRPKTWTLNSKPDAGATSSPTLLLGWLKRFFRSPLTTLNPISAPPPQLQPQPQTPRTPQIFAAPVTPDPSHNTRGRIAKAATAAMGMRRPLLAPTTPTMPSPSLTAMSSGSRRASPTSSVGGRIPLPGPLPVRIVNAAPGPREARRRHRTSDLELGPTKS